MHRQITYNLKTTEKYRWGFLKEVQIYRKEKDKNHPSLRSCYQEEFCKIVTLNIFSKTLLMHYLQKSLIFRKNQIFRTPLYKKTSGELLLMFYFSSIFLWCNYSMTGVWLIFTIWHMLSFYPFLFTLFPHI